MKWLLVAIMMVLVIILFGCNKMKNDEANAPDSSRSSISGFVFYNNLDEHSGIYVSLENNQTPGVISYQATTDKSGAYKFMNIEQGTYSLHASSQSSTEKKITRSVTVKRRSMAVIDIVLTAAGNIKGRVTLEGQTNHLGVLVFLEGTSYNAYTDPSGDFQINSIPVGNYVLDAVRSGHNPSTGTIVAVTSGTTEISMISLTTSVDNYNSLIVVTDETPGDNCTNGGKKIETGLDNGDGAGIALDGILHPDEVDTEDFVCDGGVGTNANLVTITIEPPGSNCEFGGQRIDTGFDEDGDTVLDESEIVGSPSFICDTNAKPVAISMSLIINKNSFANITLTGFDPENEPITFSNSLPVNGTLTGVAPNLVYTPDVDFTGSDSFTFLVNDGNIDSSPGTVNISVAEVTGLDTEPPQIATTYPESNVVNVPVDSAINVTFNEGMDASTITIGSFVVNDGSTNITGSVSYDDQTRMATFTPVQNLQYLTVYSVELAQAITDAVGNEMSATYNYSFTTQEATTIIVPVVESTFPPSGATTININNNITANFNKNIDSNTLNTTTFTLFDQTTPISGTVTYQNMIGVFNPDIELEYNKTYTVTVTTGVKDFDSIALASDHTWSFTTRPAPVSEIATTVSVGSEFSCAIISNQAKCWGYNSYGQLGQGDTQSRGDHSLEMGDNLPAIDLGSGLLPVSIVTGLSHACALLDNGSVKCWGYNSSGRLGLGDTANRGDNPDEMGNNLPVVELGAGRTAKQLVAGADYTCARLDDDSVKCWGYNGYGNLGLGDTNYRGDNPDEMGDNLPVVNLGTDKTAMKIAAGYYHACAILNDGNLKCWGYNGYGNLGIGNIIQIGDGAGEMGDDLPTIELGTGRLAIDVVAGDYHTCALLDNNATKCWGYNGLGQLGQGHTTSRGSSLVDMGDNLPPVSFGTNRTTTQLRTFSNHTCAILDDLSLKCWGNNGHGKLGLQDITTRGNTNGQMGDQLPIVELGSDRTAVEVSTGVNHTCALLDDGTVKCWGYNNYGQLGLGHTTTRGDGGLEMGDYLKTITPEIRSPSTLVTDIATGTDFSCAIVDSQVKCWGFNNYGQLGQGHTQYKGDHTNEMGSNLSAIDLGSGLTPVSIVTGTTHACALLDDGSVKCWGNNSYGRLGIGNTINRGDNSDEMGDNLPVVALGTGRTVVEIAAGWDYTCARLDNGSVKCWGYNGYGNLGLGDTSNRGDSLDETGDSLPVVDLGTDKTALAIAAGAYHTCAVLNDGGLKCWGYNGYGGLGVGDNIQRGDGINEMGDNLPIVDLGTSRTAVSVTAGLYYTCARLDNETTKCWGYNGYGQLGLGHTTYLGTSPGDMGDSLLAVSLGTNRFALQISTFNYHICAKLDDFSLKCWGLNGTGQLGLQTTVSKGDNSGEMGDSLLPVSIGTGRTVVKVSSGNDHTCALLDNGTLKCWGQNNYGQLGLAHTTQRGDNSNEMGDRLLPLEF
ncbi:MAG: hypothetical protein HOC24_05140 [Deltaproteobacteria bacterium]|jgi:alpha-tubulin suppressor-like RCC1 family protein|nr:hypothetical protein [Deltaproteobacteria bacterium]